MTATDSKDRLYFNLAFQLAYSIHVNKEIAFFIAEDALDELPSVLGNQGKNRRPDEGLRGFWKWGERSRPVRKTLWLNESQMLQWLVLKHSESWERQTEQGDELYLPTEEDMVVRFIKHLVFSTLRRGSFYVTLAIGSLLHQFDRREVRLLYDVLIQSDPARMKDTGYIGKQRLELFEKVCQRFGSLVQTAKKPGGEKQFVARQTTSEVADLVRDCLQRFTPWDTACVIKPKFDVTYISDLFFSGAPDSDEEITELNRIHTILEPECFSRYINGLSEYVGTLPRNHPDRGCRYGSLDKRLTIPQFMHFSGGPPRGDRFHAPELLEADYIRLRRTLEARARRKRDFIPQQLRVYVEGVLAHSFDPEITSSIEFVIGPEAEVIEVRGRDAIGELTLAILSVSREQIPAGGAFADSIVHPAGQAVEVQLTPRENSGGGIGEARVAVRYVPPESPSLFSQFGRRMGFEWAAMLKSFHRLLKAPRFGYARIAKAGVAMALVVALVALVRVQFNQPREVGGPPESGEPPSLPIPEPPKPGSPPLPPLTERPAVPKEDGAQVARAAWNTEPEAIFQAIPIETTRAEVKTVDLSPGQNKVILSIPVYDDQGRDYSRYRVSLISPARQLWQQTLRPPPGRHADSAHILTLVIFSRHLPQGVPCDLQVEGWAVGGWQSLGRLVLNPIK